MGPEDDDDDDQAERDISKLTRAEQEAMLFEDFSKMSAEDQIAFDILIRWLAERPKNSEPIGQEKMEELINDIKRENTRRRLGGRVGVILPFKRPGGDGNTGGEPL